MDHLPSPIADDEFNLYLNVDGRQVWFYFDKVDYGHTFREVRGNIPNRLLRYKSNFQTIKNLVLQFLTGDMVGGGEEVAAQCQGFECAREGRRDFYLHLGAATGIHPFALQVCLLSFLPVSLSLYLSPCVSLPVSLSLCLSPYLRVHVPICPSLCRFEPLSIFSLSLSLRSSVYLAYSYETIYYKSWLLQNQYLRNM